MLETPETPATRAKAKLPWFWILPIPVALGLGIVIGMQIATPGEPAPAVAVTHEDPGPEAPAETQQRVDVERRDAKDPTAVGKLDAPVDMVIYSDYQCGYCAKWTAESLPTILDKYVDTGKLRIEYRDIMFFGENSRQSAELGVAAGKQGKFQAFHDTIFEDGKTAKNADLSANGIEKLAERIGVDAEQFTADAAHADTVAMVQKNHDEASSLGVTGTPTFIVNGRPIIGAQPLDVFIEAIDEELAQ